MNEDYKTTTKSDTNEVKGVGAMNDSAIITKRLIFFLSFFLDLSICTDSWIYGLARIETRN